MPLVADAVVPLALLLALGYLLRRRGFVSDEAWRGLDRLTYWVFFPSLLFVATATSELGLAAAGALVPAVWGGLATVALAARALKPALGLDGPAFTSLLQGSIRFNSFVAFLVVPALYPAAEGQTALMVALTVPFVNVVAVVALLRHGSGATLRAGRLAAQIAGNPLIVATVAGLAASGVGVPLGPLEQALRLLGQVALATGLLGAGASLRFRDVRRGWRTIGVATALKFVGLPLASLAVAVVAGLPAAAWAPLALFQTMPTASSSYVLARALRGDADLMASILAVHTVAAVAWLPLAYALVDRALGG